MATLAHIGNGVGDFFYLPVACSFLRAHPSLLFFADVSGCRAFQHIGHQ